MATKSLVIRPNRASVYTYDIWQKLARADMLVSNYLKGGSWGTDEIVSMVASDTGLPERTIRWMLL